MKYRKKPVVIEAIRYGPDTCAEICAWMNIPHNVQDGEPCGVGQFLIQTLEGEMAADPGDWIIKGVKGEFYPCKPDIFDATYERAEIVPPPCPSCDRLQSELAEARGMCGELWLKYKPDYARWRQSVKGMPRGRLTADRQT